MRYLLTTALMRLVKWIHNGHCEDYEWKYGEHPAARDYMWVFERKYDPETGKPVAKIAKTCRICARRHEFSAVGKFNWEFSRNGKTKGTYCEWCGSTEGVAGVWDGGARYDAMCDCCFLLKYGRPRDDREIHQPTGWMPGVKVAKYQS